MERVFDIAIIGGGINGCGIARDAAGRGYGVFLCEMDDLAAGTSSRSTKLIHGGLRYLEYFKFRLVREALLEREVLWRIAPHLIRPMRFVLPCGAGQRSALLIRAGLFLYDHLGGRRQLPATRLLDLTTDPAGQPLRPNAFAKAFEYSDCWVDDARLVVLNAVDATRRGAIIRTGTRAVHAERAPECWELTIEDSDSRTRQRVHARTLVNAAGPWVETVLRGVVHATARARIRLVQGSHIVVPKLFDHDRAYILQNDDGRIVFAIPYEGAYTLIGTTDCDYVGNPEDTRITEDEVRYLCASVGRYFSRPPTPGDVLWAYSGLRPLYDDGVSEAKAATRDYVLELDAPAGGPPLLSIFGGKITTYRRLAEAALDRLKPYLPEPRVSGGNWTGSAPLPGGDFAPQESERLIGELARAYPFLTTAHVRRLFGAYGLLAWEVLGRARSAGDLGRSFGATLTEAEVHFLIEREWARSADDVLWRRSKLGLQLTPVESAALREWMKTVTGAERRASAVVHRQA